MKGQPTPVILPGESHGQRNLVGYTPSGHKKVGHDLAAKQNVMVFEGKLGCAEVVEPL